MNSPHNQAKTIRQQLLQAMKDGEYADCDRLPRESILSEKLGISRTQLRDILAALDREGFITRRHGIGTIINRHVLNAPSRMDIEVEFLDMIRENGHVPGVSAVHIYDGTADQQIASALQIPVGTPTICVSRICTGDGNPCIYCEDIIEKALVKEEYTLQDLKRPFFHFLQEFCHVISYLDMTDLRPVVADTMLAETMQIPVGTPLLNMNETDYDIDGHPVFFSREYFVDGYFHHTVLRKKL